VCFCVHIGTEMASGKGKLSDPRNTTSQYLCGFLGIKIVIHISILFSDIIILEFLSSFEMNISIVSSIRTLFYSACENSAFVPSVGLGIQRVQLVMWEMSM
jgi:hypothetical protein